MLMEILKSFLQKYQLLTSAIQSIWRSSKYNVLEVSNYSLLKFSFCSNLKKILLILIFHLNIILNSVSPFGYFIFIFVSHYFRFMNFFRMDYIYIYTNGTAFTDLSCLVVCMFVYICVIYVCVFCVSIVKAQVVECFVLLLLLSHMCCGYVSCS